MSAPFSDHMTLQLSPRWQKVLFFLGLLITVVLPIGSFVFTVYTATKFDNNLKQSQTNAANVTAKLADLQSKLVEADIQSKTVSQKLLETQSAQLELALSTSKLELQKRNAATLGLTLDLATTHWETKSGKTNYWAALVLNITNESLKPVNIMFTSVTLFKADELRLSDVKGDLINLHPSLAPSQAKWHEVDAHYFADPRFDFKFVGTYGAMHFPSDIRDKIDKSPLPKPVGTMLPGWPCKWAQRFIVRGKDMVGVYALVYVLYMRPNDSGVMEYEEYRTGAFDILTTFPTK